MALEDDFLEIRIHEVDPVTLEVKFSVRVKGVKCWNFVDDLTGYAGYVFTMFDGADEDDPRVVSLNRETWTEALRNNAHGGAK